jgi:hypothetical protein
VSVFRWSPRVIVSVVPASAEARERVDPWKGSGCNSERERRAAGRALLRRLDELDELGRPYHLIGHSHGGSVIWHTLRESVARGRPLKGLCTWTTVGTPFLHFRPRESRLRFVIPLLASCVAAAFVGWLVLRVGESFWPAPSSMKAAVMAEVGAWRFWIYVGLLLSLWLVEIVLLAVLAYMVGRWPWPS